ncbi:kinase-like domain-containing protein [Trichophaea hybrida]|nr:kinase-like domain-containing protein [Trichophaea hybrida]
MGMAQSTMQDRPSATNGAPAVPATTTRQKQSLVSRLRKKFNLYHRDSKHASTTTTAKEQPAPPPPLPPTPPPKDPVTPPNPRRTGRRSVVPGLPRPPTLKRMQSEKRDRLKPYEPPNHERRALSIDRRNPANQAKESSRSLKPIQSQSITSISDLQEIHAQEKAVVEKRNGNLVPGLLDFQGELKKNGKVAEEKIEEKMKEKKEEEEETAVVKADEPEQRREDITTATAPNMELAVLPRPERGPKESEPQIITACEEGLSDTSSDSWNGKEDKEPPLVSREVEEEMEWRWILNLSMHFRDESNREKFFVTYAQERNLRRRITISCDYRGAEEGTLEKELSKLRFQRDKSAKIYEAIRDSLQDIIFYDTITNLKLQTSEGRLHVHVTEDINEIISYPPVMAIAHLKCPKYRESDLEFDSHLSGFVYKVAVAGEIMIKKEIPGPDTVDEFLYEINALYALADSDNVIQFGGCVVDDQRQKVKGLLISYASKGALIDILFNQRGKLRWSTREKWAKQIVSGLSEIHEAGYVQGDFTLSNIVIDDHENAKIIDINRRGCPVGWEPPEITAMIDGLQRIGMYIGVKSDIFQLGMVLWGMAHERDEPEAMERPLTMDQAPDDVPTYFREIVEACLCDKPQGRPSAKDIISHFPEWIDDAPYIVEPPRRIDGTGWGNANGYFPEAYDLEQNALANGDPHESVQSTSHSITTSFPHSPSNFTPTPLKTLSPPLPK